MFDTNVHFDFSGEGEDIFIRWVFFFKQYLAYEFAIDQIKKINNPELFEEQEEEEEKTEEAPAEEQTEEQTEEAAEGAVEETPSQEPAAE